MPRVDEPPVTGALDGIRILDLSRVLAGPYCTMVLSDYGAEIIKVEQPGAGDGTRQWGPPWVGGESAYFLSVNRNKRSVAIDLSTSDGLALVRNLIAESDVLIENFRPGATRRLGLDYETLASDWPGLVYCSISGYGQTGPYAARPGYDLMIQAQGGIMSVTGPAEGPPSKVGVAIVDITAGLFAASAILAALLHRRATGEGQYIDVSLLDSQVAWLANVAQNYLTTKEPPARHGNAHPNIVPYETFGTSDGAIAIAVGTDEQYRIFCQRVGRPDLWQDERLRTNRGRVQHRSELIAELNELFTQRTCEYWLDIMLDAGIPASQINDIPAVLAHPQVRARNMVQTVDHPTLGSLELLGPVAKLSATPAAIRSAPPRLGADTYDVLAELVGATPDELDRWHGQGVIQIADGPTEAEGDRTS
ncbi:MAG: CoA transferase [Thermoanaerobaculia bacterium]|nr:CoA transferase [Thermoanaerobaculia bacterium]